MNLRDFGADIVEFGRTLGWYTSRKLQLFGDHFEGAKGIIVDVLKARRGTYQKPFLHVGMAFLMIVAVIIAPVMASEYPSAFAASDSGNNGTTPTSLNSQSDITNMDTVTEESEKPRREVVEHTVSSGDTLSSIAKAYGVDVDSIAYLNDFSSTKTLRPGDKVKIPPVSGVIVTVKSGDTIDSLAKKYGLLSSQSIADWPYNEFANDETFSLRAGQTLVIPGGKPPAAVPVNLTARQIPAQGIFTSGSGQFSWPTHGSITQYRTSYHTGIDIANRIGTAVSAADSGRVESVQYLKTGYGIHVIINHGNGFKTLYAHLSRVAVGEGQNIGRGELVGDMGSTGRSTGPHLHFEVINAGGAKLDPMSYLK